MNKKGTHISLLLLISLIIVGQVKAQSLKKVIYKAFENAEQQSLLMAKKYQDQQGRLPKSFEGGKDTSSDSRWWCSGFFPGSLWYLYENSKKQQLLD